MYSGGAKCGSDSEEKVLDYLEKNGIKRNGNTVELHLWGSGKPYREFLWSEDMADACVFLMENSDFKDLVEVSGITNGEVRNTHLNMVPGRKIELNEGIKMVYHHYSNKG